MTVLLTGYEPFGDHETNPSERVASRLDGAEIAGERIVGEVLPVAFDRVDDRLRRLLDEHDPSAVVSTGLAAGRSAISVERVAINVANCAGTPDNDDAEPRDEPLDPDGPDARFATLPVRGAVETLLDRGIPARLSNTAGTHCCNRALYAGVGAASGRTPEPPVGFVHLPLTPEAAARKATDGEALAGGSVPPSMPVDTQIEAIETVIEVALNGSSTHD